MAAPKVLVDLSLGHQHMGFSGIPQDTRLLFDGLAHSDRLDPEGLISPLRTSWRGHRLDKLEEQSVFMGPFLQTGNQGSLAAAALSRIHPAASNAFERAVLDARGGHTIHPLQDTLKDAAWRMYFAATVEPARRSKVMERRFYLTAVGRQRVSDAALGRLGRVSLDTRGHEFVLFQDTRPVSVPPGTRKIMRYHDGVPAFSSDLTTPSPAAVRLHIRGVNACAADSLFVCNSPSAQHDLARISPRAGENSRVIPYFVPTIKPAAGTRIDLPRMALARVSETTLGRARPSEVVGSWFGGIGATKAPEYILVLGTIEPRKNLRGLIAAWQKFRNATGKRTKLLVIGAPGWQYQPILREMQPFVGTGDLLHLEGVQQDELRYWYTAARCFAFVSFSEGFGIPPVEAMQRGCPVLVSDIEAHRYSCGDAARYCDPYDSEDIARHLDFLTRDENRAEIEAMIAKGSANAARFTLNELLPQWEDLFNNPPELARA